MKRVNAQVTNEQHKWLKKRKTKTLESMELSIRRGLDLLIEQEKAK